MMSLKDGWGLEAEQRVKRGAGPTAGGQLPIQKVSCPPLLLPPPTVIPLPAAERPGILSQSQRAAQGPEAPEPANKQGTCWGEGGRPGRLGSQAGRHK